MKRDDQTLPTRVSYPSPMELCWFNSRDIASGEVGNVQHLYVRIEGGVVTVRGIRHLYRAAPHQMHTAIGISKRAAIDNLNSQRTVGPSLHVALEALIHAIDEVSARSVLGQRQTDLDVFLSIGHLRRQ